MKAQDTPVAKLTNIKLFREDKLILSDICVELVAGQSLAILGPNGSGKSSLLKIMAGLLLPTSGQINLGEQVNYMGHILPLDPRLTASQNIEFLGGGENSYGDMPVLSLSQGQQKKLFLSYFVAQKAKKIWLMDEPFSHLDAASIESLIADMKAHQASGGCVVLTHHGDLPLAVDGVINLI